MAWLSSVALAAFALAALLAVASADVYSDNVAAFAKAIKKYPQYSTFANQYVNYMNSPGVKKYMSQPALILIPSNTAIQTNPAFQKLKLNSMMKVVGFHAVIFPKTAAPLSYEGLVKLAAGRTIKTQEGGVITKVSGPNKTPVKLRGKKPAVVSVVDNLFNSTTLNAFGIDGIMTPSDM